MPEYLAPGVYVEEVSFRSNTIEGVGTSTAGFVGPTLFGPPFGVPELLTSLSDFEGIYGGIDELQFEDAGETVNYMAQGVRAFFENGGQQLYVARTFTSVLPGTETTDPAAVYVPNGPQGCATVTIDAGFSPSESIALRARWPGSYGSVTVTFTVHASNNVLAGIPHNPADPTGPKDPVLRGVNEYDTVWISFATSPPTRELYWAENYLDPVAKQWRWQFHSESGGALPLSALHPGPGGDDVRVVTVSVQVDYPGAFPRSDTFDSLTFHPSHPQSLSQYFALEPTSRSAALTLPIVFDPEGLYNSGPLIARIMMSQPPGAVERGRLLRLLSLSPTDTTTNLSILATLGYAQLADSDRQIQVVLSGGLDGFHPVATQYEGVDTDPAAKTALKSFEDLTDISIVAAPGYSAGGNGTELQQANMLTVAGLLIAHCEKMRYRIAVLDSADSQDLTDVSLYRGQLDSEWAALYYPWVRILDPVTDTEINLPPSGFVAGLYADNDILYGVHKAPANMVVQLFIGFEVLLNKAQQDVLNPQGINCFRFFEGRGYRLWGARTISSDPEWKYVNLRRYFAYLEHSIDLGTQWVVFEVNNETLWERVTRTVSDFLLNEWRSNHLMGDKPEQAYFVRCDRTTMTQNDLDNGRLICLVGVAPTRPAEFVIFRIGQWVGGQS
jgi:phage tail sheath protein FI